MSIKPAHHKKAGFSLFEVLMTVAILGIMASLAMSAFGSQGESYQEVRDRRNAQELVATYTAARAAGFDFVASGAVEPIVRKLIDGATPTTGVFKNRVFKVNLLAEADIAGASRFLQIQNGELLVRP